MENFCLLIDQGNKAYSCKLISTCNPYDSKTKEEKADIVREKKEFGIRFSKDMCSVV